MKKILKSFVWTVWLGLTVLFILSPSFSFILAILINGVWWCFSIAGVLTFYIQQDQKYIAAQHTIHDMNIHIQMAEEDRTQLTTLNAEMEARNNVQYGTITDLQIQYQFMTVGRDRARKQVNQLKDTIERYKNMEQRYHILKVESEQKSED